MTINEYIKKNDLPEMKILGEMKNFKYYIEIPQPLAATGIPMVIEENKIHHRFNVVNADRALDLMRLF